MTISKIEIENIRGFQKESLVVNLRENCTNIIVAPNGFGKSSISTAFHCARGGNLNVVGKDKYNKDEISTPILSIKYNDKKLTANPSSNEISENFDIHVIRASIEPKAKLPKMNGFTIAKPYLEMPSIDLGPKIEKEKIKFDIRRYRELFGYNAKIAPNVASICDDAQLRIALLSILPSIDKLKQKRSSNLLDQIFDISKNLVGTRSSISDKLESMFSSKIDKVSQIKDVCDVLAKYNHNSSWLNRVLTCYVFNDLIKSDRLNFKKWLQYAVYSVRLKSQREFIERINAAWVSAEIKESNGRVIVNFPEAESLSNGQRDILYFGCNLLRARESTSVKPCILIIDEVFDYLDDANIVVAQYFLSKIIDAYRDGGGKIYICLLTHLDPAHFKGYALKRQQTIYLGDDSQKISNTMAKIIGQRDDPVWSAELSRYFLHYHPDECDISEIFNSEYSLPKRHGKSRGFYKFLQGEWDKLLMKSGSYDPFAVCAYVRIMIEQCAFSKIRHQIDKNKFLAECNGTARKLEFAEGIGIQVPEVCLLLGVVYNDALHQKGTIKQSSTIALKLRNLGLQGMMRQAISW